MEREEKVVCTWAAVRDWVKMNGVICSICLCFGGCWGKGGRKGEKREEGEWRHFEAVVMWVV